MRESDLCAILAMFCLGLFVVEVYFLIRFLGWLLS